MTHDEILNMSAGKEMDALIAQDLMGWIYYDGWNHPLANEVQGELPSYSTDIAAAWEVVKKIGENKHRQWYLCTNFSAEFGNQIYAEIFERMDESEFTICSATAETAPLAICRAALIAVTK
jgi:hypothetical protein